MGFLKKLFGKPVAAKLQNQDSDNDTVDLSKVFQRIKGIFDEETTDPKPNPNGAIMTLSESDSPVFQTLAKGLGIFYAIDKGNRYQLLQNRNLSDSVTLEDLRNAASKNMTAEVWEKTEINGDPANIMMLTNGGNFEAAMLLVDDMWENLEQVFNDEVCVAIPARDLLFIAGKNNPAGRESLRAIVRKFFDERETEGLLVRHIYARENKQWVLVETA